MNLVKHIAIYSIVLFLLVLSPIQAQSTGIWFDDISTTVSLSDDEADSLMTYLVDVVIDGNRSTSYPAQLPTIDSPQIIFLSVSDSIRQAHVFMGRGDSLRLAILDAVRQLDTLSPLFNPQWLKLDFVTSVEQRNLTTYDTQVELERSLYGLAFEEVSNLAFLPEELVSITLVDSSNDIRIDNIHEYLTEQHRPERLDETATNPTIYRFGTLGYFSDGTSTTQLYRGNRLTNDITSDDLLSAMALGGDYLRDAVKPNGQFVYSYLPKSNRDDNGYNILRHAGTTFSMLEVYEITQDPALLASIEQVLGYLVNQVRPCTGFITGDSALCLVEDDEVKLGGHGLAILAISKYTSLTGDDTYLSIAQGLAEWIVGSQDDAGNAVHKISFSSNMDSGFVSGYYPGEAIFGLMRLYAIDGDDRWLQSAVATARYLILIRDGDVPADELEHDHWLLYGLNEVYRAEPDPIYIDHAEKIVTAIMGAQLTDAPYPDWNGGFRSPPTAAPTATRIEGLCATYHLFRDFNDSADLDRMLTALILGAQFQLTAQFQPESVMYLQDPQRALGGIRKTLTNYEVRIDYVQHSISNLICIAGLIE